jgi:hypothetical protein
MCLTEIPGLLADPTASSWGATLGCVSLVTFFAQAKKVTRAKRETLFLPSKNKDQSKIKSTPPQSSPALRAREEAEAGAKSRSKWMTSHSAVEKRFQRSLG